MNKKILALAIGGVLSAGAQAATIDNILITEYVEPDGGNLKALEISNLGTGDFRFPDDVYISKQQNGDAAKWALSINSEKKSTLEGKVLAEGKTIIFLTTHADSDALNTSLTTGGTKVIRTGVMGHNGNDALALVKVADSSSMDKYGNIDGTKKEILDIVGVADNADNWGKNVTLRRKVAITEQNITYDIGEWNSLPNPKNNVITTGLGTIPSNDPDSSAPPTPGVQCSTETQTEIGAIQGEGFKSPLIKSSYETTEEYNVTGVISGVTKYFPVKGFYLYKSDGDERTSDGLFVKTDTDASALIGQTVCVTSKVYENYGRTELRSDNWEVVNATVQDVPATPVKIIAADTTPENGFNFDATLERYESMKVTFTEDMDDAKTGDQDMRVAKPYSFDYSDFRTNLMISYERPNTHPNQRFAAGSQESKDQSTANFQRRVIVDTDQKGKASNMLYYTDFAANPANNYVRIDDSVIGLEGILTYNSAYKKYADFYLVAPNSNITDLSFKHNTDRTTAKELAASLNKVPDGEIEIKIATQNVLNFFNSPFGGEENKHGENRGADSQSEYTKQKAKIVAAVRGLDADIIGLMEIENNSFNDFSAIKDLVDSVNEYYTQDRPSKEHYSDSISKRYAFVGFDSNGDLVLDKEDSIGSDAITSGMLYRPKSVSLKDVKVISMPNQQDKPVVNDYGEVVKNYKGEVLESGKNYQRDSLAVTFTINQTGKDLTVAVNHLKSKGSTCAEEWDGVDLGTKTSLKFNEDKSLVKDDDFQGSCENFRVAAAVQLGTEMAKIEGDKVLVGDMNSYAQEHPMLVLTNIPAGTEVKAARNTFIGKKPQYGQDGAIITDSFGYLNAVSIKDAHGWSYSYNDHIGSLDHALITQSLKDRLVDATDWHINAAESPIYDYNEDRKDNKADEFYVDDAYRSSDHDSAIIVLSYKHAETENGKPVHLVNNLSGSVKVPYNIPVSADAKKGDIATITLTPLEHSPDMERVTLPNIALDDGQSLVEFEIYGAPSGLYKATMELQKQSVKSSSSTANNSKVELEISIAKKDSLEPKITVPKSDESGGSFSIFGILSLLCLGFLRKKA
ncbi:ExeM/NucH family extracellular endonuclease [Moritella viscosa]|uniref:Extracellular deoxyribonuclease Xds n=1 Tax=Moritella viscosa TaxID=80854 RepID=A0A1L0B8M9_9GAMM|nr:ExeM/NucH family extracellular endonuclease [Moritella viscosa]SGY98285.1 Extracellular deoxyribonuclease Xds [Moritella viscosa]SHO08382.1 Extracellular deoxyribonuclease Xds [Moritella viscosa]